MNDMVRLEGVSKSYGEVVALGATDLVIREGEFLTLLGPSGSGKTTILNLIAGTAAATSGRIFIGGRDVTRVPSSQRRLGMVFQSYALFPHMTVAENIAFPLQLRKLGRSEIEAEVRKVLDLIRLPHVAGRKPKELSGGQQQRVAIARSLVYKPDLILMDEPLGALDKKLREQMQIEIKRIHETLGTTLLYVTHDQEEALTMSDRICLMSNGKIEQIGTPSELYFAPSTKFAADFLGESNILPARIGRGGTTLTVAESVEIPLQALNTTASDAAAIMLRPEMIHLADQADTDRFTFDATVEEIIFAGSVTNVYTKLKTGEQVIFKRLTDGAAASMHKGQQVRLAARFADVVTLR